MGENKKIPSPVFCMQRDRNVINFILDHVVHGEPASIIGMTGMGKDVIFSQLLEDVNNISLTYGVKSIIATNVEELKGFMKDLQNFSTPTVVIVNIRIGEDVSWFVEDLERLRNKHGTKFVPVIFAYIKDVYLALEKLNKLLTSSLFILKPVDISDEKILLSELESRFDTQISKEQKQKILQLSKGHVGLLKSLFILAKENADILFTQNRLITESSVLYRINASITELPQDKIKALSQNTPSFADKLFLEQFGYLYNGQIFNPLFRAYLEKNDLVPTSNFNRHLTNLELNLFNILKAHIEDVVDRTELAQAIWEEKWEEKY